MEDYKHAGLIVQRLNWYNLELPLQNSYEITINESLNKFNSYLIRLGKDLPIKEYKEEYLIGCLYHSKRSLNPAEYSNFAKAHLYLGVKCFTELQSQIEQREKGIDDNILIKYRDQIIEYIFDLKDFIEYFETKKNEEFELFSGFITKSISSFEIFKSVESFYWFPNINLKNIDYKVKANTSVFLIRQSLEVKFKRIFGIVDIYNKSFTGPKLKSDLYANFIKKYLNFFQTPQMEIQYLVKIYEWTNYTIHNAIIPRVWEIQFAIDILRKWFKGEVTYFDDGSIKSANVYGNVKIKEFDLVFLKLIDEINKNAKDVHCIELTTPECIKI